MPTRRLQPSDRRSAERAALNTASSSVVVVAQTEIATTDAESAIALDRWQRLAVAALQTEGVTAGELNLLFIDEQAMAELNGQHMGGAGPTDVLAFPIDGSDVLDDGAGPPALLGDVVVCPAVARRNALRHGHGFDDEMALLVVHGVLHVLGHDHAEPEETATMQARERALLRAHHRPAAPSS